MCDAGVMHHHKQQQHFFNTKLRVVGWLVVSPKDFCCCFFVVFVFFSELISAAFHRIGIKTLPFLIVPGTNFPGQIFYHRFCISKNVRIKKKKKKKKKNNERQHVFVYAADFFSISNVKNFIYFQHFLCLINQNFHFIFVKRIYINLCKIYVKCKI